MGAEVVVNGVQAASFLHQATPINTLESPPLLMICVCGFRDLHTRSDSTCHDDCNE